MSLLLKALKQAEAAKAAEPERPTAFDRVEPAPPPPREAVRPHEWVEPPGLLFGSATQTGRPAPRLGWQRPALLPAIAMLATLAALAYAVYVYFALQPSAVATPSATPAPEAVVRPPLEAAAPSTSAVAPPTEVAPPAIEAAAAPSEVKRQQPRAAARGDRLPPQMSSRTRESAPAPEPAPAAPVFQPDAQSAQLSDAYAAYQAGKLDVAERLYTEAAARRRSVDALLGLAAIASLRNRDSDAQRLYREVLELDPRHAVAQAALLELLGNGDSAAVENRLKALIARDPTPQLYQSLGHHYAGQGRWKDAQAAYFEAYRGAPDSADYAYNLAVGLDRLQQYPAARRYYEQALAGSGAHRFDRAQVQARMQQLNQLDGEVHGTP